MNDRLKEIIIDLENFSVKPKKEQQKIKFELEKLAEIDRSHFEREISKITPSENSILFEIYESLSVKPHQWIDLIISEFRRIKEIAEKSELKDQDSISSPLSALSFFARNEYIGLNELIQELSISTKSTSDSIVKISMDILMDIYFIDIEKYKYIKDIIEKQSLSSNREINEYAKLLLKDKIINPIWYNLKKFLTNNSWLIWTIILLVIMCFNYGYKKGFTLTGIFLSGILLGYIIVMTINDLFRGHEFKHLYKEMIIFIILIGTLYFSLNNKLTLIYLFPISLPVIIVGLITIWKTKK